MLKTRFKRAIIFMALLLALPAVSHAENWENPKRSGFIQKLIEKKMESRKKDNGSEKGFYVKGKGESHNENLDGRNFIVYTPPDLPRKGNIPLVIVLHGGFGNAGHIQNYLGLDPLADQHGFMVAYLSGTQVAAKLPAKMGGWNAGGCCGLPQKKKIDDIGFITAVIGFMEHEYGIDPAQVYGTGHSNGAMMSLRIMCETNLYRTAAVYAGTLQRDIRKCPAAQGDRIVNIHGSEDKNLPIEGGHTEEGFNKQTDYKSQAYTKTLFERSGATYDLILLEGADHSPETINAALWATEGISLPQKIVSELGLD